MKEVSAEIVIEAPVDRVWEILTDFAKFPEWNPFIKQMTGEPRTGARLEVRLEPPGGRAMTFKPENDQCRNEQGDVLARPTLDTGLV